jgi:hydroxymethylpyrimidine pyrophosphatase-like HAD family hydrolase
MNNIKAIILDLDGTLLDDNKKISEKTRIKKKK